MADNVYIPEVGGDLVTREGDENTYKLRKLKDGSENLVLKNYYSAKELEEIFSRHIKDFNLRNVFYGNCFWYVTYKWM